MNTLELSLYLKCITTHITRLDFFCLCFVSGISYFNYALFPCTVNERISFTGNVKHSREPSRSVIRAAGLCWCTSSPRKIWWWAHSSVMFLYTLDRTRKLSWYLCFTNYLMFPLQISACQNQLLYATHLPYWKPERYQISRS